MDWVRCRGSAASQVADVAPSPIVWLKTDEGDTFDPTVLLSVSAYGCGVSVCDVYED